MLTEATILTDGPLTECALAGRRRGEGVIRHVLTTDVPEGTSKVVKSHGQAVVQSPQCGNEGVGNTREATARGSVGLEHHERFSDLLSDQGSIAVLLDEVDTGSVGKVRGKHILGLAGGSICVHRDQHASPSR